MRGFACALALLGSMPAAADAPEPYMLEEERPDQPPGKPARDDAFARSPGMRVPFGSYESMQVNVDALGANIVGDAANEPSIAVNPLNPSNIVIGFRQFDTVSSNWRQAGFAYTFDGGQSWTFPGSLQPGFFRSDPSLDADASGTFYYQSLRGPSLWRVDVYRSTNGGVSWTGVPAFGGDKNWMVVDRSGGGTDGALYGIWSRFNSCCGNNVFTRSLDGGLSFDPPISVSHWPTYGTMAVGPDGEVYATGMDGAVDFNRIVLAISTNASDPAATPAFSSSDVNLGGYPILNQDPNPGGLLGQPNVFVNHAPGPRRGEVYVLQSVRPGTAGLVPPDPMDVRFARRAAGPEGGFSAPVRVNDDTVNAWLNWQWMAAGSVGPTGRIDAVWLDGRNGAGNIQLAQLFYAYSWDGGATWSPNAAVTPLFDSSLGYPNQNKMGDYMTIVSGETGADVAFTATLNGEEDVYYVRVFPDCDGNGVSDVVDLASPSVLDCNANHVPDGCESAPVCLGAGSVPGGLTVERAGADLLLEWDASCAQDDDDYAIYEGTLGSFATHVPRACTTGGATSRLVTPGEGDTYYLVVPTHADREGSYGRDGAGNERAPSPSACYPQQAGACGP